MPAFQPYWGKPAVRNDRGDRGNVGIIRSPVRASILPDRNPWLWAALLLCTVLLAVPPYLPPMADVMHLVPPTSIMWALILGLSAAPVIVTQAVMLTLASLRPRG